jgi:hypothetical protein
MFHGYYDFLLNDIKIKPKSRPIVLHQKTCPVCEKKLVNLYYSAQVDMYMCKSCMDKMIK